MQEALKKLLNDAASLPEDAMRISLLKRRFATLSPAEIARFLALVYNRDHSLKGKERIKSALIDPASLSNILDKDKRALAYTAALEMGLMNVSRLFTNLSAHKSGLTGYDKEEEIKMEHVSLGERRSLSKISSKDALSRLLSDPDPVVITNLLNNPRIVEKDVLKAASKRPNSPKILGAIARHGKWSKNYNVKKAVVMNPYAPPRLAIGLMDSLLAQDITQIAGDLTLHPQVRAAAKDMTEGESA